MNRESRDHGNIGEKTDGAIMNRESRDHGNIGEKTDGAIMNRESRDHGNIGHNIQNELSLDGPKSSTYLYFILPKTDILKAGTARAPEITPVLGHFENYLITSA
jgi:hypothetical protein